jgi:nucleoside-diphosphate-sugar epimerase
MILFDPGHASAGEGPLTAALFGLGVIGFGVLEALRGRGDGAAQLLPFDWNDAALRGQQLQEVEAALDDRHRRGKRVDVLWSAGRAGFLSQDAQVELELRIFRQVLDMAERLARRGRTRFHLISSAGGLFEGQRHVEPHSLPAPPRPYGRMKLVQEQLLEQSVAELEKRVYRVSSAYGLIRDRFRPGLVSRLVLDGIRRKVTQITARMTTLRDFVFVPDVARYVAGQLLDDAGAATAPLFLVHSRPCSLLEVQRTVEEVMGRKLHVAYSMDPDNSADITFSPAVLPPAWQPSDLRSNIGIIYRDALCSGFGGRGDGSGHGLRPIL